ncbi:flagellar export protein FliJ [Hyphomicrobium sp. CS1GBMeth3]|uniref:flagellar export protein FliJ n=1 Tax=Hyphomicrobium sp. CS1GBMeth3 TaxID=1892845 RepID=UPI0009317C6B|nr:flagellar export protein FliJ [Hyphomicrobium sp. CS1GBMeth3]
MKARETALRLKRFELNEKARKVSDLEMMIREFETIAGDLDRQIQAEEERTGVKDARHFAYSTFAKSAALRRDNLRASIAELRAKLEAAQQDYDATQQQLERVSTDQPREVSRNRRRPDRPTGLALR